MQLFKRVMSLILAFVLLLGNVPAVYAAEAETISVTEAVETEAPETTAEVIPEETEVPTEETEPPVEETTIVTEETEPVTEPAEETTPAETVPEETVEETVPEETVEETIPEETEGELVIPGLPEGYELGEKDAWHRQSLLDNGYPEILKNQTFVEDQILVFAADEEEAALFAAAFGGELTSFSGGIAQITLNGITAAEAVEASLAREILLPAASPNHTVKEEEKIVMSGMLTASANAAMAGVGDDAPVPQDWDYWVNVVEVDDPDLQGPADADYQWWHDMLDTYTAWGVTLGSEFVDIALVTQHEIRTGSGYDLDADRLTFAPASGPNSGYGEYTGYSGTLEYIIGPLNNGTEGAGIAPNGVATIYNTRWNPYAFETSVMGIVECLNAVAKNPHKLVLVTEYIPYYSPILEDAVNNVLDEDISVIASVGEAETNMLTWPAAFDGVIGVAAVGRDGKRSFGSAFGPQVDLAAPAPNEWQIVEAAALVAGAAALYISAQPDWDAVTPASLEKALEAACVKSSDKNLGAGILNLAKLFGGKPTAPEYIVVDGVGFQELDAKGNIPCESFVVFQSSEGAADDNGILLVTDNGKAPAVKDGKIVSGFTVSGSGETYYLDLADYAGKTITLKAAWVSGTGIMGKVTTVKLKVAKSSNIARIDLSGTGVTAETGYFSAAALSGKSYTYTATLIPQTYTTLDGETITAEVTDQRVTWTIETKSADLTAAKIDKNGKLTLPKGKEGVLILSATAVADPDVKAYLQVSVENLNPVKTVVLNDIVYDKTEDFGYISIKQLLDAKGNDLSAYLMVFDVQWTSSNTKVAEIRPIDGMPGYAEIIRKGPGKVKFTATVLDGGNAKATSANFTMKQKVESISFTGGVEYGAYYYYLSQPGKTVTPKVNVLPKNATDKSLTYTITESTAPGISVDPNTGKVTVGKTVPYGSGAKIVATANDGSDVQGAFVVMVYPKAHTLAVGLDLAPWEEDDYRPAYDKNGNLTELTLFTITPPSSSVDMTEIVVFAASFSTINGTDAHMPAIASNSAPGVIGVTQNDDAFYLTALKPGTAKLTFKSPDSAKKHTVTVNVVTPASSVDISSNITYEYDFGRPLAEGATAKHTAVLGDAYGKVTNTKNVTWDLEVELDPFYATPEEIAAAEAMRPAIEKLVTFKNGSLTFKKGLWDYNVKLADLSVDLYFNVRAIKDGLVSEEICYVVQPKTTVMTPDQKTYTIDTATYVGENTYRVKIWTDGRVPLTATSSNPAAASVISCGSEWGYDWEKVYNVVEVTIPKTVEKVTNVTVTVTTADGSNKSCKVTLKLMPKLEIKHALPEYDSMHILAAGCSTTLKARFGTTAAKVDWSVKLKYDVLDEAAQTYLDQVKDQLENGIKIDSKGKLSVDKSLAAVLYDLNNVKHLPLRINAEVTATAKEGGGSTTVTYEIVDPETYVKPSVSTLTIDTSQYVGASYSGLEVLSNTAPWLQVTVSNPKLVSVTPDNFIVMTSDKVVHKDYFVNILQEVTKPTNVTVTFKTVDGTNKSFKVTLKLVP